MAIVKCKDCGKDISPKAKTCPSCGAPVRRPFFRLRNVIVGAVLVLMIISCLGRLSRSSNSIQSASGPSASTSDSPDDSGVSIPADQAGFIRVIQKSRDQFDAAKNDLQRSAARKSRKQDLAAAMPSLSAHDWIGTVADLTTNSEGKAVLSLNLEHAQWIKVETWNNAISDVVHGTLIAMDSGLYKSLADLSEGDRVRFTGEFFRAVEDIDFLQEGSLTEQGSMQEPAFLFRFKSVVKY